MTATGGGGGERGRAAGGAGESRCGWRSGWKSRARRVALAWAGLLAFGAVSGCQRVEALDRRVEAETPAEFHAWQEAALARLPEETADEFREAVAWIAAFSPSKMALNDRGMWHSRFHPVCRELDGKTVRQVLVAGYEAVNAELLRASIFDADLLIALLKLPDAVEGTPTERLRLQRQAERRNDALATARVRIAWNRGRIAELKAGAPGPAPGFFVRFAVWRAWVLLVA